jgi:chromosome segregation ATPase
MDGTDPKGRRIVISPLETFIILSRLGADRKPEMGSKVLKQKLYEYEATLKHRDNKIEELQKRIQAEEEEIKGLRFAMNEKQKDIESLSSAIERKDQEWEFKINEQKAQMNGIMAEKDARLKKIEELLKNRETELERQTTKDNYFKKQIQSKERSLKIARSAANEKEKEIDILRKRLETKEQELKVITEELKIEMSSLLTEKDDLIKKLERSLKVKESELERKYVEVKESKEQMHAKEEEFTTIRSVMKQREQEVSELTKALESKEQELKSSKSEESTTLRAMEKRVRVISMKGQSFWESLKAFFRVDRKQHH